MEADDPRLETATPTPRPPRKRSGSTSSKSRTASSSPISGSTAVVERDVEPSVPTAGSPQGIDVDLDDPDPSAPLVFGVPDATVVDDPSLPTIVPALPGGDAPATAPQPVTAVSPAVLAELADPSTPVAMAEPVLRQPRVFGRRPRPRVRRVTRIVRHVDTWSVFKVALVFNLFMYAVLLISGVLLWQVAESTGTVDNIETFFETFGWETFEFDSGEIFHNAWVGGLFLVVGFTGLAVLSATLFNLITDLVGGVRLSVLEEEVLSREDRGTASRGIPRPTLPPDAAG